jgi:hypothetical protein
MIIFPASLIFFASGVVAVEKTRSSYRKKQRVSRLLRSPGALRRSSSAVEMREKKHGVRRVEPNMNLLPDSVPINEDPQRPLRSFFS